MSLLNPPKLLLGRCILPSTHLKDVFKWCSIPIKLSEKLCTTARAEEQDVIDNIFPDVKGTAQPIPKNYFKKSKNLRSGKFENDPKNNSPGELANNSKHAIIECKHKRLNHYINQKYDKLAAIPLASKGWFNKEARGDYFKINILPEDKRNDVFWFDGIDSFGCLGLDKNIVETLEKLGFSKPTYIQAFGIPEVLNNQNTLLAGETGCGKTLAYLIPLVQEIMRWRTFTPNRKLNCPLAIVLVPGKELTFQIADVADRLAKELLFDIEVAVGGHTKRMISHPNFRPVDLFVCSIGAARKLTAAGIFNMSYVRHVVLDEADTCLDDSFNESLVNYLKYFPISFGKHPGDEVNRLPQFSKLTLASATMPTSIAPILGKIIQPESLVTVESPRLHQVLVHVPQIFHRLGQSQKPPKLLELAKKNAKQGRPTIIFSNRSKVSDWVSMFLNENGISCVNLNGDMPVDIRAGRFDQFQRGFVDFLSCTDMVSRGLDTIRAKHVLNYDFPVYMADYIHRCGRVGRVGHIDNCMITNFVASDSEIELVRKIETAVRTMKVLPNVNANITRVIHHKIMKNTLPK
ncbi:probable ATP-dependent RNA helicase DDX28 isoform X2 [Macrosteles quadrilineatus]|uniref:probable ATP-dependent RNA helicase DDX28 isoform X2 n=1 Tax=Macrosteles quadrilineatus TaxID=74068 RepID=UPI0023E0F163|nr:probable ATP-dependent RNA helicase DDX28 isoform X2 [Macrosteles quadrilineatus]